ncbi:MAG: hypothetical protein Ct9H300mP7_2040 [Verrucomicrobiota bacterium]|nr:MAG: hypothetical protein Ct9H300mP7_2040 [Verrucomicrobiota bacterium]
MSWQHGVELLEKVPGLKWVSTPPIPSSTPTAPTQPWPKQDPWEYGNSPEHPGPHPHQGCVGVDEKDDADYTFPGKGEDASATSC